MLLILETDNLPQDQQSLLNAMKFLQKIGQSQPLASVITTQTNPPVNESDADLLTYVMRKPSFLKIDILI